MAAISLTKPMADSGPDMDSSLNFPSRPLTKDEHTIINASGRPKRERKVRDAVYVYKPPIQ